MSEVAQETTKKLKEAAAKIDRKARKLAQVNRRRWFDIGQVAYEVSSKSLWKYMGKKYDTEKDYRADIDIGRATWYRCRRLYELLAPKIKTPDLQKISGENAEHLARALAGNIPLDAKLLKKAQELKEFQFEELVNRLLGKMDAEASGDDTADERVMFVLKVGMSRAQRDFIMETLDEFKAEHGLKPEEEARALELIFADARERSDSEFKAVTVAVNSAVTELRMAATLLKSGKSADEILEGMAQRIQNAANLLAWKSTTPPPKQAAMAEAVQ